MIILIIIRYCFFVFFFPETKLQRKLWIPPVLQILSEEARRGLLNCLVHKVLTRAEAGRNSFVWFSSGHFFPLPWGWGCSWCCHVWVCVVTNQPPMVHRDGNEPNDGHLFNIPIIFPVFKTGEGWCWVGGGHLKTFLWSQDKRSCFPCVENGMDVMLNFRFSLFIYFRDTMSLFDPPPWLDRVISLI